jgi:hypothetical protein
MVGSCVVGLRWSTASWRPKRGNTYPNADADAHADTHANADADADANADAYSDAYTHADAYSDAYTHANAYSDAYTHANAYSDAYTHANAYSDAYTHADHQCVGCLGHQYGQDAEQDAVGFSLVDIRSKFHQLDVPHDGQQHP